MQRDAFKSLAYKVIDAPGWFVNDDIIYYALSLSFISFKVITGHEHNS